MIPGGNHPGFILTVLRQPGYAAPFSLEESVISFFFEGVIPEADIPILSNCDTGVNLLGMAHIQDLSRVSLKNNLGFLFIKTEAEETPITVLHQPSSITLLQQTENMCCFTIFIRHLEDFLGFEVKIRLVIPFCLVDFIIIPYFYESILPSAYYGISFY